MTGALEQEEAAASNVPAPVSPAAIKAALVEAWPPAMIALGGLLSLLWSGTLLWLVLWAILALV